MCPGVVAPPDPGCPLTAPTHVARHMASGSKQSPYAIRRPRRNGAWLAFALGLFGAVALIGLLLSGDAGNPLSTLFGAGNRGLHAALFQTAPLRTAQGGVDRVYFISTQSQTWVFRGARSISESRADYLHVDLWAIDAATDTVAWRRRLRTYTNEERRDRILPGFDILGVDGTTLWLNVEGPLGVSLADGHTVADPARIEQRNPELAGKLVIEPGYVAFGRNGLQVTLEDASQWRIDAADLKAAPRDTPVSHPEDIAPPANPLPSSTSSFQMRGVSVGNSWLGVLTDKEADTLSHPPVIPGRDPNERPGVMQQFLNENHVPQPLDIPLPQPYRLWQAQVKEVSAAPPGWPKELPDNWGTRSEFSKYKAMPEAPAFLRAGLLREHRDAEVPLWYRNPDSVLVLHVDKLGEAGRLQLSRVSGPNGKVVWRAALPMVSLASVMRGADNLLLWGGEPDQSGRPATRGMPWHAKLVRIDVASGTFVALDLTAESFTRSPLADEGPR